MPTVGVPSEVDVCVQVTNVNDLQLQMDTMAETLKS